MTSVEASQILALFDAVVNAEAIANPKLAILAPIIKWFVSDQLHKLEAGVANGSIVPDGKGGYVPSTNSHYVKSTGEFI